MDVVVGCGKGKLDRTAPVADLYTGPYIRAAVRWARTLPQVRLFILSAKHGLLPGDTPCAPYSASFARHGFAAEVGHLDPTVETTTTRAQVITHGLTGDLVVLAGRDYLNHLTTAAGDLIRPRNPFADAAAARYGDRRQGYQMKLMIENPGHLPQRSTP